MFLKGESVSIFDGENKGKKQLYKIQVERYILNKAKSQIIDKLNLEPIYEID